MTEFLRSRRGGVALLLVLLSAGPAGWLVHAFVLAQTPKIDLTRWSLDSHYELPYPKEVPQLTRPVSAELSGYQRLLYKGPGRVTSMEADLILGAPGYVDIICRQEGTPPDERVILFRLSRSPLKKSGFLKMERQVCVATDQMSDRFSESTGPIAMEPARFLEYTRSARFRRALATADDPTDAKRYRLKVGIEGDRFSVSVNGERIGSYEDRSIENGSVGLQSGGSPPVVLERITLETEDEGQAVTVADDFTPPVAGAGYRALFIGGAVLVALCGWLGYGLLLARVCRVDLRTILWVDSASFLLAPPLAWFLSYHWMFGLWAPGVALGVPLLFKLSFVMWHRRALQFGRAPVAGARQPFPLGAARCAAVGCGLAVVAVLLLAAAGRLPPTAQEPQREGVSYDPLSLPDGYGAASFYPAGYRTGDATLEAAVTLGADSELEIFFRKDRRHQQHEWYALRLSTVPNRPTTFRKSSGPAETTEGRQPEAGRRHTVSLTLEGDRFVAALDGAPMGAWRDDEYAVGEWGFVVREGTATVDRFDVTPTGRPAGPGERAWRRGLTLGLKLMALPIGWLLYGWAVGRVGRLSIRHLMTYDVLTYLPLALYALPVALGLRVDRGFGTDGAILRMGAVGATLGLKMVYLGINRDGCRRYGLLMLAGFGALLLNVELGLRSSSMEPNYRLFPSEPGYIKKQYSYFAHKDFDNLWASYLRRSALRSGAHSVAKKPGTYRILFLGGSTTYGHGVRAEAHSYPGLLETLLNAKAGTGPKVEVMNAGYPGYTTEDALAQYRRDLARYELDMIVVRLIVNDIFPMPWADEQYRLAQLQQDRSGLSTLQRSVDRSRLLGWAGQTAARLRSERVAGTTRPPVGSERYRENLEAFVRIAQERGVPLIFVDEPFSDIEQFAKGIAYRYQAIGREVAERAKVPFVELTHGPFEKHRNDQLFCDPVHTTARGNALIAGELAREIRKARESAPGPPLPTP